MYTRARPAKYSLRLSVVVVLVPRWSNPLIPSSVDTASASAKLFFVFGHGGVLKPSAIITNASMTFL